MICMPRWRPQPTPAGSSLLNAWKCFVITREMESLGYSSNLAGHFSEQSMQQLPRDEKWGYVQEDRAFIDAIVNGSAPPVTAVDGLMSVKLVEAVYRSVETGGHTVQIE